MLWLLERTPGTARVVLRCCWLKRRLQSLQSESLSWLAAQQYLWGVLRQAMP